MVALVFPRLHAVLCHFASRALQQQALLEEDTTMGRLKAVEELLDGTVKYLAAQVRCRLRGSAALQLSVG